MPERKPRRGIAGEHVVAGRRQPVTEAGQERDAVRHTCAGERGDAGP
ncbi:MAG TPA: hypothetical protein VMB27_22620 [Solirubrobacteraceae bacterium]|nr:hypothetical protein [Solirubrobacteraceae bacterium]